MLERTASPPIGAILFDLDGTLVDTEAQVARALVETLSTFGYTVTPSQARDLGGQPLRAWFTAGLGMSAPQAETIYGAYLQRTLDAYAARATPMPHAERLLSGLHKRDVPLAIVTTRPSTIAHVILQATGWSPYFRVVVAQETAAHPKPAPDPAEYALRTLGIRAEQAVMVGNTEADMYCAVQAGLPTVIGLLGERSAEVLYAAGATHVCKDLTEVEALLLDC